MSPARNGKTAAIAIAFVSGIVFAVGLGVAGMTRPTKVIGFLDVTGAWDPSLAFVMIGAIGVFFFAAERARKGRAPWLVPSYALPEAKGIDAPLVFGAVLFGIGWGASGFCPGPALVSVATCSSKVLVFVAAMVAGMVLFDRWQARASVLLRSDEHREARERPSVER